MVRRLGSSFRESFSGLPRPVWLLAAVSLVNRSGTMVIVFLALYLTEKKGFTTAQAGSLLGLYGIGAIAGSLLGGWLSDRMTARKIMAGSLVLSGFAYFLLGYVDRPATIAVLIVALSVVAEAFRPANAAALTEAAPPGERVRALALSRLAVNLGLTFGPAVGGVLATYSYGWLFLVDGGTSLLAAAILLAFLGTGRAARPAGAHDGSAPSRSPWRDGPYLALLFLMLILASVLFQFISAWPIFLHERYGLSEAAIGSLTSVNTLIIVALQMPILKALGGRDHLKVAGFGAMLFCLGFAILPLGTGYPFAVMTVVVWTAGEMLSMPLIEGAAANRADERSRGSYMGVFTVAFTTAMTVGPFIGTWAYQAYGPESLWYGCGVAGIVAWAGFHWLAPRMAPRGGPGAEEEEEMIPEAGV